MELGRLGIVAECTQLAGDLLYVPRLWMHATRAREESVAIAVEFCSAVGSVEFAHLERISPEMYGSDPTMDVEVISAGLRDFFHPRMQILATCAQEKRYSFHWQIFTGKVTGKGVGACDKEEKVEKVENAVSYTSYIVKWSCISIYFSQVLNSF